MAVRGLRQVRKFRGVTRAGIRNMLRYAVSLQTRNARAVPHFLTQLQSDALDLQIVTLQQLLSQKIFV